MKARAIAVLLSFTPAAAQPALSSAAAAAIAPIRQAYETVHADQTRLPPAKDTAEALLRLQDLDQAERNAMSGLKLDGLSRADAEAAIQAIYVDMKRHDGENREALKRLIPAEGWFRTSIYGRRAATAAFLVVQHAVDDPELMHRVLVKMEALRPAGEVDGEDYALLYDRVSLMDGKPQRYGSQVECRDGRMQFAAPLEDPARLDERRRQVGMKQSSAEYLAIFAQQPCR